MKITASLNIQNNCSRGIERHVSRQFEDYKNGNPYSIQLNHINTTLSPYNENSYGDIVRKNHKNYQVDPFLISNTQLRNKLELFINSYFNSYVSARNKSHTTKANKNRFIHNLFKDRLLKPLSLYEQKHNRGAKNKFNKYERSIVQDIGTTDFTQKVIHLLMRKKHANYHIIRNKYLKVCSNALIQNTLSINKRHPHLHLTFFGSNVDEVLRNNKQVPSAPHIHYTILGACWTHLNKKFKPQKNSRPSFNFMRALCLDEKEHYSKNSGIKIPAHNKNGYRIVNKSIHNAFKKFRKQEGISQLKILNKLIIKDFHVNLHLQYIQTHQKFNGLTEQEEQFRQEYKHKEQKLEKKILRLKKNKSQKNYKNAINRRRTYERNYKRYKRHLAKVKTEERRIKKTIKQQELTMKKNDIRIQEQNHQIKANVMKLQN